MRGRKTLRDELKVIERYSELSGPYFGFVRKMLGSGKTSDRKWGAEQLKGAYIKMLPQEVTGKDGTPITIQMTMYGQEDEKLVTTRSLPILKKV